MLRQEESRMGYSRQDILKYIKAVIGVQSYIDIVETEMHQLSKDYGKRLSSLKRQYQTPPTAPQKPSKYVPELASKWTIIGHMILRAKAKKINAARLRDYNERVQTYKQEMAAYEKRKNNEDMLPDEYVEEKHKVNEYYFYLKSEKEKAEDLLVRLKSLNVINPAYIDNMDALVCFQSYFEDELVFELAGPGGAYARYRDDLKHKELQEKFNMIDQTVSEYNTRLARERARMNQQIESMQAQNAATTAELAQISLNTSLMAFDTGMMAVNSFFR